MSADPLGSLFAKIRDDVREEQASEPAPELGPSSERGARTAPEPMPEPPAPEPTTEPVGEAAPRATEPDSSAEHLVVALDLVEVEPVEPEPRWPAFSTAESATLDDAALRLRRDVAVAAAVRSIAPQVKRLLQDEQNELLDRVRRKKGKGDAAEAIAPEHEQVARWVQVLRTAVDDLYAAGRVLGGGRSRPAPDGLVDQLVRLIVLPFRDRVTTSLEGAIREGPFDSLPDLQRAVSSAVGARYREWRSQDLDAALGDLATWAFAWGVYDATPDGMQMRWVPAEVEQCPDADDNALEPTRKGLPFPTGQCCPPAHAGCRCLVVPARV